MFDDFSAFFPHILKKKQPPSLAHKFIAIKLSDPYDRIGGELDYSDFSINWVQARKKFLKKISAIILPYNFNLQSEL